MYGAYGTYGGNVLTGFWWGKMKERGHFVDQIIDRSVVVVLVIIIIII